MENMLYAEELVREFLIFRGFTNTLQVYQTELSTDIGKGFDVDKLLDLVFSVYVPKYQAEKLVALLSFFKQYVSTIPETALLSTLLKLETSILRYYIVQAMQSGRKDKVVEFLGTSGNDLLQRGQDWISWFAIPYLKNPSLDPQFRLYFSKEWFDALRLSFRNFLSQIFNSTRIPSLLKISTEKNTVKRLKKDIKQLNLTLSQLQALLEEKEAQICHLRSKTPTLEAMMLQKSISTDSLTGTPRKEEERQTGDCNVSDSSKPSTSLTLPQSEHDSSSLAKHSAEGSESRDTYQMFQENYYSAENGEVQREEEFPEVKIDFQETFLGHTSPITRCRFSASGSNIASASVDGTVRIWTYDSSTPTSRNAAIYCGAEIMSLDWECKSDRLLLIGTADGGIKAWNVDAKRVVCDLNTTQAFPSVLDLKCSPVEPIFVSAAASRGTGSSNLDNMKFASLTVWNMKTWKPMTVLPLGEDPPAITSLSFNHNGKILAAAATDGMIHIFDMSAGLQIAGWPAHDSAISSVLFGHDETSIFGLGSDGKVFEWSLHNQGQILWSRDCSRLCAYFVAMYLKMLLVFYCEFQAYSILGLSVCVTVYASWSGTRMF
ncbi:hypothetical protein AQUCO_03700007v1 [Aquilegia coerulea]|uniref:Uncharacterized protein n=1 Tax=Aquilegia coerulea TaxID=218851 RepID=A0A2G5CT31_AQUCA|nr:hypothetical protein AQUCO_03700007v1 [Aquilegia coerulea]